VDIENECTLKEVQSKIDHEIDTLWQKTYTNSATAKSYKAIEPTVSREIKCINENRTKEVVITRLRLGKCCLNTYLHRIKKHDTGLCTACGTPETVEHFLLACPFSNIFFGSDIKTLKEAFSPENIDKIYKRVKELRRKI
jgi:hypothetical protein